MNKYAMIAVKTIVTTGVPGITIADAKIPAIPATVNAATTLPMAVAGAGSGGLLS